MTQVIRMSQAPVGWQTNPEYVYIGRAGHGSDGYFGNPFPLQQEHRRAEVLNRYREYFHDRMFRDDEFNHAIEFLRGKTLVCFCKPFACHGDVIAEYLDR